MDPILEGIKSASDLAKQLITLSTAILALSITFTKDILQGLPSRQAWLLKLAWIANLLSICFGVWALMALTGMTFHLPSQGSAATQSNPYGSSVFPAAVQIILFVLGIVFIIGYGFKSLGPMKAAPKNNS